MPSDLRQLGIDIDELNSESISEKPLKKALSLTKTKSVGSASRKTDEEDALSENYEQTKKDEELAKKTQDMFLVSGMRCIDGPDPDQHHYSRRSSACLKKGVSAKNAKLQQLYKMRVPREKTTEVIAKMFRRQR